jgi:amiloride-sensitive sodium channel
MQAMFHDPEDYPDAGLHTALVEPRQVVSVMLEAQVIESVNTVRWIDVDSRRCWFDDEVAVMQSSPSYSFQTCITECRMKVLQEKCGCIPFFYPLFGQHLSLNYHIISLTKQMNSSTYSPNAIAWFCFR